MTADGPIDEWRKTGVKTAGLFLVSGLVGWRPFLRMVGRRRSRIIQARVLLIHDPIVRPPTRDGFFEEGEPFVLNGVRLELVGQVILIPVQALDVDRFDECRSAARGRTRRASSAHSNHLLLLPNPWGLLACRDRLERYTCLGEAGPPGENLGGGVPCLDALRGGPGYCSGGLTSTVILGRVSVAIH